jgi:hypothetical protein
MRSGFLGTEPLEGFRVPWNGTLGGVRVSGNGTLGRVPKIKEP